MTITNSETSAGTLNARWDGLIAVYDKYFTKIPGTVRSLVDKAITDWQDFYFGNTNEWPMAEIHRWDAIFLKTAATMTAAIPQGTAADVITPSKPAAVVKGNDAVFSILGATTRPKLGLAWILIPLLPLAYYYARKD